MGEMGNATVRPYKQLINLIQRISYRHSTWQVFSDFVQMSAIAISNAVDWNRQEEREKQYMETIQKYNPEEQKLFPLLLGNLINALEGQAANDGPSDVLGQLFHELELHNRWTGQFFTPDHLCEMMGQIALEDHAKEIIEQKGFITLSEPAAGSGAMVLGFCRAMLKQKLDYGRQLVVTATDIDMKCVHMAYLQFSLYGIPAVVIYGNTLTVEEWSRWYTPAYVLDGWIRRQHCGMTEKRKPMIVNLVPESRPIFSEVFEQLSMFGSR